MLSRCNGLCPNVIDRYFSQSEAILAFWKMQGQSGPVSFLAFNAVSIGLFHTALNFHVMRDIILLVRLSNPPTVRDQAYGWEIHSRT